MKQLSFRTRSIIEIGATLVILLLLNYIAGLTFERYDITGDQRFTLKDETIALLEDEEAYPDHLYLKIYFDGELPADWHNFRKEVTLKLEEYKEYAGDRFQYEFINPFADPATKDDILSELREKGLEDIWISDPSGQDRVQCVPGAILTYPGAEDVAVSFIPVRQNGYPLNYVKLNRNEVLNAMDNALLNLEFELSQGIRKITRRNRPTVAFLEGNGELTEEQTHSATKTLSEYYHVTRVALTAEDSLGQAREDIHALDDVDLLIIAKPQKKFSERQKFLLDQYAMKGGKIIWSVDMINDHRDSLYMGQGFTYGIPYEENLNLLDQLHKYGVRIEPVLVLESNTNKAPCHIPVLNKPGLEPAVIFRMFPWDFYPVVNGRPQKIVKNGEVETSEPHIISKNLSPVKLEYASFIEVLDKQDKIQKTVILETSDSCSFRRAPVEIFANLITQPKNHNQRDLPVAVLLEGEFVSLFKNRLPPTFTESSDIDFREMSVPTKMMVISDGDIFKNDVDTLSKPGLRVPVSLDSCIYGIRNPNLNYITYGNEEFLRNSVEYLLGEDVMPTQYKRMRENLNMALVEDEKMKWQFLNIGLPLLTIILFGFFQMLLRRQKYTK